MQEVTHNTRAFCALYENHTAFSQRWSKLYTTHSGIENIIITTYDRACLLLLLFSKNPRLAENVI